MTETPPSDMGSTGMIVPGKYVKPTVGRGKLLMRESRSTFELYYPRPMNLKRLACTILIVSTVIETVFAGNFNEGAIWGSDKDADRVGPVLHTANIQIKAATCSSPNGSITNLTVSNVIGTPFIEWVDSANKHIAYSYDILQVPAGKYQFKLKDQSAADTIFSAFFIVGGLGDISIDTISKAIRPAGCAVKGSIGNMRVTGADLLQWKNVSTNTVVGSELTLTGLDPGEYQLTASNSFGCSLTSPILTVLQSSFVPIAVTGTQSRNAVCGENNGIIRITHFNNEADYYSFRWIDSARKTVAGTGTELHNLGAGTYILFATDSNGCESQIFKGTIRAFAKPYFDLSDLEIDNDRCSLKIGSIKGIRIRGLVGPSATHSWMNADGESVTNTDQLKNIGAGQYRLTVIDGGSCLVQTPFFTVINQNQLSAPQYDEVIVPRNSPVVLKVRNFVPGNYMLYEDEAGTQLIEKNSTGMFATKIISETRNFYIRLVTGTCTSAMVAVKVVVVDKSFFAIPSAFTPNGDGLNDLLNVKVIGFMELEYFRIYNRGGELVYATKTVNGGWDGRYKGAMQPSSAYVWLAKGKDMNGNPVMERGSFVLIR